MTRGVDAVEERIAGPWKRDSRVAAGTVKESLLTVWDRIVYSGDLTGGVDGKGIRIGTARNRESREAAALRNELRKADATKRSTLLAVTHQFHRSAAANISPLQALAELRMAIDLLQPVMSETMQPVPRARPMLRVIQGGLSNG